MIGPETNHPQAVNGEQTNILDLFPGPLSEDDYLLIKLRCIFYQPLPEKDIEEIAKRRNIDPEAVRVELDQLMDALIKREETRVEDQNKAGVDWMLLCRRRAQLKDLRENALLNAIRIKAVEKDIEELSRKLEEDREEANKMICPKNMELAAILGVPLKSAGKINTRLHRIRRKLSESLEGKRRGGRAPH